VHSRCSGIKRWKAGVRWRCRRHLSPRTNSGSFGYYFDCGGSGLVLPGSSHDQAIHKGSNHHAHFELVESEVVIEQKENLSLYVVELCATEINAIHCPVFVTRSGVIEIFGGDYKYCQE
jgi:hypothetical protein